MQIDFIIHIQTSICYIYKAIKLLLFKHSKMKICSKLIYRTGRRRQMENEWNENFANYHKFNLFLSPHIHIYIYMHKCIQTNMIETFVERIIKARNCIENICNSAHKAKWKAKKKSFGHCRILIWLCDSMNTMNGEEEEGGEDWIYVEKTLEMKLNRTYWSWLHTLFLLLLLQFAKILAC